jgi:hypothetical protein
MEEHLPPELPLISTRVVPGKTEYSRNILVEGSILEGSKGQLRKSHPVERQTPIVLC